MAEGAGGGKAEDAEEDGKGNGDIASEEQPSDSPPPFFKNRAHLSSCDTEGLKEAGDAMAKVHGKQSDREYVEAGHEGVRKARNNHAVDVMAPLRVMPTPVLGSEGLPGELGQMEKDEGKDYQAGKAHQARVDSGIQIILHRVLLRTGAHVLMPKGNREPDMETDTGQQEETDHPEDLAEALQELGVGVDCVGAKEDGEIPK